MGCGVSPKSSLLAEGGRLPRTIRRWGALLCLAAGAALAYHPLQAPGVYLADVNVVLLMPSATTDNALTARPAALADFAGIVASSVAGRGGGDITVSDDVTLAGQGILDGWSVRQPNSGGQWNYSFDQPVLEVQATGPSAAAVLARVEMVITRIRDDIARLEAEAGARPEQGVRLALSPSEPIVLYDEGARRRAAVAALIASAAAAVAVLRWPPRGQQKRSSPSPGRGDGATWPEGSIAHRTTAGDQA